MGVGNVTQGGIAGYNCLGTPLLSATNSAGAGNVYGGGGYYDDSGASGAVVFASSGGYLEKLLTGLTPGNTLALTIGAAGTATGTLHGAGALGVCKIEWFS
jgi:hypothetical protein